MVDDLNPVAVRIPKITGASPVSMRAGFCSEGDPATFEKRRPRIDVLARPHDETQVIESTRVLLGSASEMRAVKREIIGPR